MRFTRAIALAVAASVHLASAFPANEVVQARDETSADLSKAVTSPASSLFTNVDEVKLAGEKREPGKKGKAAKKQAAKTQAAKTGKTRKGRKGKGKGGKTRKAKAGKKGKGKGGKTRKAKTQKAKARKAKTAKTQKAKAAKVGRARVARAAEDDVPFEASDLVARFLEERDAAPEYILVPRSLAAESDESENQSAGVTIRRDEEEAAEPVQAVEFEA
ncbi:hypothetical protein AAL_06595 [Moelleriella libera RCEF 2490]|uniref:Uncharacterized protein n=1 Tax=Moelleriella libera RCEF 2490 TaxID=1081109 RepID=A0A167YHR4_9HYPO|nr:hypothetical protein AAL_06595 [Moelleriella libera RCEF 2490]